MFEPIVAPLAESMEAINLGPAHHRQDLIGYRPSANRMASRCEASSPGSDHEP